MRLRKKAYMRTLEAFIAFIMTFSFLIFIAASRHSSTEPDTPQLYVLHNFEQRPDFRDCVYINNITCIEDLVNSSIPRAYGFHATVNDASYEREENTFVDSLYLTGSTASSQYVVRLYYWKEH
ncbi:hypothetical protein ACFL96_13555 [Thermoproteota archaeon]